MSRRGAKTCGMLTGARLAALRYAQFEVRDD